MTLRDKIAEAVRKYRNHHPKYSADAILDVIREGVKPLEWIEGPRHLDCDLSCNTGIYQISNDEGMTMMWIGHDECALFYETTEAAKAAAQADYTRRILSALGIDQ